MSFFDKIKDATIVNMFK